MLFRAELVRCFTLLVRYPFELVSRLIWNLSFALVVYWGLGAMGPGFTLQPGFHQAQLDRLLALLVSYIAINGLVSATEAIAADTRDGTMEQAALSPPPLVVVFLMRDLAALVEMLLRFGLVLGIVALLTGVRYHGDVLSYAVLLGLMFLGMEGLGLLLGGLALLYKRTPTLVYAAVMGIFAVAMFPLRDATGWLGWLVAAFPYSHALPLLQDVGVRAIPLGTLARQGALGGLALDAMACLALGLLVFAWADRRARTLGTLNQY